MKQSVVVNNFISDGFDASAPAEQRQGDRMIHKTASAAMMQRRVGAFCVY